MKISGAATMHAPADKVWIALNDPAVLVRTIPGCEQLEATGPDSYRLTVTAGVASIKGTYTGEVALSDKQEPASFLMTASGAGGPGTVSTSVQVRLAPNGDGGTELSYDADAVIGGMIASVGQRMLVSVAKKMAREFFTAVDDVLTGREALAPVGGGRQAAVAGPGGVGEAAGAAAPGVYVAPGRDVRRGGPDGQAFLRGVLVGAAVALAGVAVGSLLGAQSALTPMAGHIRIGIDTGGTFTDVVAFDETTGELTVTKTPSTPADPAQGFMAGLEKMLGLLGTGMDAVASVSHGTTIATNQLLEGNVGRLGFITSEGFEFILEIARQSVPDGYGNSYFWVKPDRIVPPDLVKTVGGRMDHTGAEMRPFDEAQAIEVARWFRDRGVETLGVCFLHSYANPEHEERMAAVLAREHPKAVISLSSQVLPEYREYERSMTTLVDAAVKPRVSRYLASIAERLEQVAGTDGGGGGRQRSAMSRQTETPGQRTRAAVSRLDGQSNSAPPLHVMTSSGGVVTAEQVISQPISTVLSGPAAGAVGAAMIAQNAGIDQVLTCDGGGTSTDVAVVVGGEPALTTEGSVGVYPSKIPMVDVVTVGAGGGSVAWVSPEGALKVGPRSAGADPGPLCYGKGGREVTVTDAHLVLGRIPPHLLGGEVPLDAEAARAGVADLAKRLGLADEECAAGILEISAWNQANAVRQITVKRGLDVRDFTLVTFGGSGSLLLCPLIEILGVRGVLVPPNPGNVSAFGLLTVDVRSDYVRTAVARHAELDHGAMDAIFDGLAGQAHGALTAQGFSLDEHRLSRTADLRYYGQAFEVRVPVGDGRFGPELADAAASAFHDAHHALYGYDFRGDLRQQVEWVNLRVTGIGPIQRPELTELAPADRSDTGSRVRRPGVSVCRDGAPALPSHRSSGRAATGSRLVVFGRSSTGVSTPLYWRPQLAPGDVVAGPAIIEEYGATVPVHPGFAARVDRFGNLLVTAEGAPL